MRMDIKQTCTELSIWARPRCIFSYQARWEYNIAGRCSFDLFLKSSSPAFPMQRTQLFMSKVSFGAISHIALPTAELHSINPGVLRVRFTLISWENKHDQHSGEISNRQVNMAREVELHINKAKQSITIYHGYVVFHFAR